MGLLLSVVAQLLSVSGQLLSVTGKRLSVAGQRLSVMDNILPDPSSSSILTEGVYYHPSPKDVLTVEEILIQFLSPKLVDSIVDLAEYWPRVVSSVGVDPPGDEMEEVDAMEELCFPVVSLSADEARWCAVLTEPLMLNSRGEGGREGKVKRVRFEIVSHDQGWSGEHERFKGTYYGSHTWFQASIIHACPSNSSPFRNLILDHRAPFDFIRFTKEIGLSLEGDDDLGPEGRMWMVQANVHARKVWQRHVVEWDTSARSHNDEGVEAEGEGCETTTGKRGIFIDELGEGDRVVLWACAKYAAWVNYVRFAKIEVFYSV